MNGIVVRWYCNCYSYEQTKICLFFHLKSFFILHTTKCHANQKTWKMKNHEKFRKTKMKLFVMSNLFLHFWCFHEKFDGDNNHGIYRKIKIKQGGISFLLFMLHFPGDTFLFFMKRFVCEKTLTSGRVNKNVNFHE